jgi:hypothetical protein
MVKEYQSGSYMCKTIQLDQHKHVNYYYLSITRDWRRAFTTATQGGAGKVELAAAAAADKKARAAVWMQLARVGVSSARAALVLAASARSASCSSDSCCARACVGVGPRLLRCRNRLLPVVVLGCCLLSY